jgi:hypothetical protein
MSTQLVPLNFFAVKVLTHAVPLNLAEFVNGTDVVGPVILFPTIPSV